MDINTFYKKSLAIYPDNDSSKFFELKDIVRLNNSNILKLDDVLLYPKLLYGVVGFDFETTGFNPKEDKVLGVGFSDNYHHVYLELTETNFDMIKAHIELQFKKADVIACHNLKFEYKFCKEFFGVVMPKEKCYDTMLIPYCYQFKVKKLSKLAETLLGRYPYEFKELPNMEVTTLAPYCAEDAYECVLLYDYYKEHYIEPDNFKTDLYNIISIAEMELLGVNVRRAMVLEFLDTLEKGLNSLESSFEFATGESKDILTSPAKKSNYLYNVLGLPTDGIKKGKSGSYSTDKDSLKELEGLHSSVNLMVNYSLIKTLQGFAKSLDELIINNKIYPQTNTMQTVTGRLSMSEPNLQQSPNPAKYAATGNELIYQLGKGFRQLLIPRPFCKFVVADYPSFEFRILATLSEDDTLLSIFNNNLDFHITICSDLFNIVYDKQNTQHKLYRTVTKSINYGAVYGMKAKRLQRECLKAGITYSLTECEDILRKYWSNLSKVYSFFIREKIKAVLNGYSENMFGRKRFYSFNDYKLITTVQDTWSSTDLDYIRDEVIINFWENEIEGKGLDKKDMSYWSQIMNYQLQSVNADVVRQQINSLPTALGKLGTLLFTVHDEFIIECRSRNVELCYNILKKELESSINLLVPLPIEPCIANSWGDAK